MSRDTRRGIYSQPATLNRFAFARGNPTNRCDPTGCGDEPCWLEPTPPGTPPLPPPSLNPPPLPPYIKPPWPDPDEKLDDPIDRQQAVGAIVEALVPESDLRAVILAIAALETGVPHHWDNEIEHPAGEYNGIIQVTLGSGYHDPNNPPGKYENTWRGIEDNLSDGITCFMDHLTSVRGGPFGDYGAIFDDLPYSDIVRAVLHYNCGPSPIGIYSNNKGTPSYLHYVAIRLESTVPEKFGYSRPAIAQALEDGQSILKYHYPDFDYDK